MRFIDLEQIEPEIRDLIPSLDEATESVLAEQDPDARATYIRAQRARWAALRPALEAISHGKCWYVECVNPGTDDDVDHFRPKLGVDGVPEHPGYYWLAFNWRNFRLSCHRANRRRINPEGAGTGGKGGQFPIFDPTTRAFTPADPLTREVPILLDPTNMFDVALLTFSQNGEVGLSPLYKDQPVPEAKVATSRLALHLDWPAFRDARVVLYNTIVRHINRGNREAPTDYADGFSPSEAFMDAARDLVAVMDPREEYSSAARVYVESFKHIWWVRDVVLVVTS